MTKRHILEKVGRNKDVYKDYLAWKDKYRNFMVRLTLKYGLSPRTLRIIIKREEQYANVSRG